MLLLFLIPGALKLYPSFPPVSPPYPKIPWTPNEAFLILGMLIASR